MMRKISASSFYRGEDMRPRTVTGYRSDTRAGVAKGDSYYACQEMYSTVKPLDLGGRPVRETPIYRSRH